MMTSAIESMKTESDFINREEELKSINEVLDNLTSPGKLLPKVILEFNGIGGIGKTALLKEILKQCRNKPNLHSAFIDLGQLRINEALDRKELILDITKQIGLTNTLSEKLLEISKRNDTAPVLPDSTALFIRYLKSFIESTLKKQALVIFFDAMDEISEGDQQWLLSIIKEVVDINTNNLLFLFASKRSLEIENIPEIDKWAYSFKLEELQEKYSLQQIQVLGRSKGNQEMENWASEIYEITCGHPLANEIVVQDILEKEYDQQCFMDRQYELVQNIDRYVVTDKIFYGYSDADIKRFKEILTPLAVTRMFNLISMKKLIEAFSSDYALGSSWHYSNYIREFKKNTGFLCYSKEKSAYVVEPVLRSNFFRILKQENSQRFKDINDYLIDLYSEWFSEAKGTDKTKFFLEKIYHLMNAGYSEQDLLKIFEKFSLSIGAGMSVEQQGNVNQLFIEEFELDRDLNRFFSVSAKEIIKIQFNGF